MTCFARQSFSIGGLVNASTWSLLQRRCRYRHALWIALLLLLPLASILHHQSSQSATGKPSS